jgi:5-amino-6-(5-phosphoribosylamino)uracil reductase
MNEPLLEPGIEPRLKPQTTVILAMSADGKIADYQRSPARFGSAQDKAHLEQQVAQADAVLFGAATLRAYGTTMTVRDPALQQQRQALGKPIQPIQIVCSGSGQLDRRWRFFAQPVPRWLLTHGAGDWGEPEFERILTMPAPIDWPSVFGQLAAEGIERLAVLGGGTLVGGILAAGLVDELWLTVCPLVLGGVSAASPVDGSGFLATLAPRLVLLDCRRVGDEVFLHYRVVR